MIPQQVDAAVQEGKRTIKVISADTDVFVLLCSMYLHNDWSTSNVVMENFLGDHRLTDIQMTVERNVNIIPSLIAMHALSGCDIVPMLFGIGKAKALAVVEQIPLKHLGHENASIEEVLLESRRFVAKCYGQSEPSSSKNRYVQ